MTRPKAARPWSTTRTAFLTVAAVAIIAHLSAANAQAFSSIGGGFGHIWHVKADPAGANMAVIGALAAGFDDSGYASGGAVFQVHDFDARESLQIKAELLGVELTLDDERNVVGASFSGLATVSTAGGTRDAVIEIAISPSSTTLVLSDGVETETLSIGPPAGPFAMETHGKVTSTVAMVGTRIGDDGRLETIMAAAGAGTSADETLGRSFVEETGGRNPFIADGDVNDLQVSTGYSGTTIRLRGTSTVQKRDGSSVADYDLMFSERRDPHVPTRLSFLAPRGGARAVISSGAGGYLGWATFPSD